MDEFNELYLLDGINNITIFKFYFENIITGRTCSIDYISRNGLEYFFVNSNYLEYDVYEALKTFVKTFFLCEI